jgi:hypothetical protein
MQVSFGGAKQITARSRRAIAARSQTAAEFLSSAMISREFRGFGVDTAEETSSVG